MIARLLAALRAGPDASTPAPRPPMRGRLIKVRGSWALEFHGGSADTCRALGTRPLILLVSIAKHAPRSAVIERLRSENPHIEIDGDPAVPLASDPAPASDPTPDGESRT